MKKIFLKNTIFLLLILALFSFASLSYNAFTKEEVKNNLNLKTAEATAGYDIEGWAWSDNIGWISFNCSNMGNCGTSNYSVVIDASKELSGYAWSDNIGWISFNESELSGCPSGACKAWLDSSDNLKGWAKALAGENEDDGWDGWISLNCLSNGSCGTSNYKVDLIRSNSSFDGYAWGSDVVGWLKFEGGDVDVDGDVDEEVTASISANRTNIQTGESVHIDWNSSEADECSGTCSGEGTCNFSTGGATSGSLNTVALSEDTSYSVRCSNASYDGEDSVSIVVSTPISDSDNEDTDSVSVATSTLTASISAVQGGEGVHNVQVGESVHINWSSSGAEECVGSCSGEEDCNFSTGGATSGVHNTVALSEDTSYSMRCSNTFYDGEDSVSVNVLVSVSVGVLMPNLQISFSPSDIRRGDTTNLSWQAENVGSCNVTGPTGGIGTSLTESATEDESPFTSLTKSATVGPIENESTFTLSCDTRGGVNFEETATITPVPDWREF